MYAWIFIVLCALALLSFLLRKANNAPMSRLDRPLPDDLVPYKETKVFTKANCPKGLLTRHNTKAGTWGVVRVTKGSVRYVVLSGPDEGLSVVVETGHTFWTGPQVYHSVEFLGDDSAFYVEFWGQKGVHPPNFIKKSLIRDVEEEDEHKHM